MSAQGQVDFRQRELEQWVAAELGVEHIYGQPASSDASFRRYFRFVHEDRSLIAMDAPPDTEDCRPFVAVADLLRQAGVHVPNIIARDLERGFLLLSDLGTQTYLELLNDGNADPLFDDAIGALLCIQRASVAGVLPEYDEALLRRELELFPEWYLGRHLKLVLAPEQRIQLDRLFELLVRRALSQGRVFVHRDFMPRNLMASQPNPGVLDFQDAVYGPISYDPVCLFRDAFLSWPRQRVIDWLQRYWEQARQHGLPVPEQFDDFVTDCDWMGVQRHLKVIGIFARICHRDGKPRYLEDVPRFFTYLRDVAERYTELEPLRALLDIVGEGAGAPV